MMTVNAENRYAAAMTDIQAKNHGSAMVNLLELLEVERNPAARVVALIAAAELGIVHFLRSSRPNKHLTEARTILDTEGNLPAVYSAHCDTLEGHRLVQNGEYGPAADTFLTAIFKYRAAGDETNAINGEMLLAACRLAQGDTTNALGICRKVRMNPACDGRKATENQKASPSRLLELNALQAKVAAALGKEDDALRFAGRVLEDVRSIIGDAQFRALAEVVTVAGVEFVGKRVSGLACMGAHPFPLSLSVIG